MEKSDAAKIRNILYSPQNIFLPAKKEGDDIIIVNIMSENVRQIMTQGVVMAAAVVIMVLMVLSLSSLSLLLLLLSLLLLPLLLLLLTKHHLLLLFLLKGKR